jgi:glycosyltransferase involved in cell wall biosynthesis
MIVFSLPHLKISGGVRVVLTYAHELRARGEEVTILVKETSRLRRWFKNIFSPGVSWFGPLGKIKIIYINEQTAPRVLARLKPAVVVADSWPMAALAATLPESVKKFHLIQHDERLYHGTPEAVAKVYTLPTQKIVVATWLKEMLTRDFNQSAAVLLNSFDRQIFKPEPQAKPNDGLVRVLILDHPYHWKGTKEAVEMVNNLKLKYANLRLMAFGSRRQQPDNNYDEYYYQPAQSELANIYSRADIFLCSSWDEGFGLPSLEAMACGTAVVTYDNGGSRDFAIDGETALVAPRQERTILESKLEQLISNQELRQKIAQKGLTLAKGWSTWSDQATKLEKILKNGITL